MTVVRKFGGGFFMKQVRFIPLITLILLFFNQEYVTVPGKRDHLGNFFKIELLLPQGRVGFELQNALHI